MSRWIFLALVSMVLGVYAVPSACWHASFNQGFEAATAKTPEAGTYSAETLLENMTTYLQPGVEGTAVLVGTGPDKKTDYHVTYSNKSQWITPEKGSVVFWVCPQDWSGTDKKFHMLFRGEGRDGDLMIYKGSWGPNLLFIIGPNTPVNGKKVWTVTQTSIKDWKPGEWHFVAAVWGAKKARLYIDGLLKDTRDYKVPASDFRQIGIGGLRPKAWTTPMDYTLMDEVMMYNVPLTNEDVLARYGAYKQGRINAPDERLVVPTNVYSGYNEKNQSMDFHFSVRFVSPKNRYYKTDVKIVNSSGVCVYQELMAPSGSEFKLSVPLTKLVPGSYQAQLTVQKEDASLNKMVSYPFAIPARPEWWANNKIGAEPTAPAPWTAPKWDEAKGSFSCWNRQYLFGKSFLPTQLYSGKSPLLTRPVQLRLDGKAIGNTSLKVVSATDERITLEGTEDVGSFVATMKIYGEFDGFFWADLELKPKNAKAVFTNLSLDFPLEKSASTLFNAMHKQYGHYFPGYAGNFRNISLNLFGAESRCIFVGNDQIGLEWFCEELSSWNLTKNDKSLQLIAGPKENLLRLNFADKAVKPGRSYRYRFGFQTLPVRPMPQDWRCVRVKQPGKRNFNPWFPWANKHNVPDAACKHPDYDKRYKNAVSYNENVCWYFAGFTNSPDTKEWSFYGPMWSQTPPPIGFVGAPNEPEWAFVRNCPVAPNYVDYYVANLKRTVETLKITNLYFDNQDAQFCDNTLHGCSWTGMDGQVYSSYNLLATRELCKRIYRMFKTVRPQGRIMRHMSMKNITAVTGFADFLADGEAYCITVGKDESYMNAFSPDMFRALYTSNVYGIPNYFIPQFQRAIRLNGPDKNRYKNAWMTAEHLKKQQDKLRHFIGYFLVHDALIWPQFGVDCTSWFAIQDRFGLNGQERFIMYNDSASPFVSKGRLMASSYLLGGRMMVIVMNDEKTPCTSLDFNAAKLKSLGVTLHKVTDAENNQPVAVEGSRLKTYIPPRDYRVYFIE